MATSTQETDVSGVGTTQSTQSTVPVVPAAILPTPPFRQPSQSYECVIRGCPLGHHEDRIECYLPKCKNEVHWHCYVRRVLGGARSDVKPKEHFWPGNSNVAVCGRRHLTQAAALCKRASSSANIGWTEDSLKGPDDCNNSQTFLVEWLTTSDNYSRYRSGEQGKRKTAICEQIADFINSKGVKKPRTGTMVFKKISRLETSYRKALDWTNRTGQGVHDKRLFDDYVREICPLFFMLEPIMRDRANSTCVVNSDHIRPGAMSTTPILELSPPSSPAPSAGSFGLMLHGQEEQKEEEEQDQGDIQEFDESERSQEASDGSNVNPDGSNVNPDGFVTQPPTRPPTATTLTASVATASSVVTTANTAVTPDIANKRKSIHTASQEKQQRTTTKPITTISRPLTKWEKEMLVIEHDKWNIQKAKNELDYKFELLKKYKELRAMGYGDAQIKSFIPAMSAVISGIAGDTAE